MIADALIRCSLGYLGAVPWALGGLGIPPRQLRIHVDRRATPAGFGELRSGVDPGFRE